VATEGSTALASSIACSKKTNPVSAADRVAADGDLLGAT